MAKKIKVKFKRDHLEGMMNLIEKLIALEYSTDENKLLMAVLASVRSRIYQKLDSIASECTMSFNAQEAFALRIMANDIYNPSEFKNALSYKLHSIANDVHRTFI